MGVKGLVPGLGRRASSRNTRPLSPCPDREGACPERARAQNGVVGRLPHWEGASLGDRMTDGAEEEGPGSRWVPGGPWCPAERDWAVWASSSNEIVFGTDS